MENVMTNSFCELNEQEMMMVDGGEGSLFEKLGKAAGTGFHNWCNFWEGYGAYVQENGLF